MMLVGTNASHILPFPVDGRHVPGNFGLEFRKFGRDQINDGPGSQLLRGAGDTPASTGTPLSSIGRIPTRRGIEWLEILRLRSG
jgi:hypothetical protein